MWPGNKAKFLASISYKTSGTQEIPAIYWKDRPQFLSCAPWCSYFHFPSCILHPVSLWHISTITGRNHPQVTISVDQVDHILSSAASSSRRCHCIKVHKAGTSPPRLEIKWRLKLSTFCLQKNNPTKKLCSEILQETDIVSLHYKMVWSYY